MEWARFGGSVLPAAATVVTRTGSKARIQDPNAGAGGQDDLQPIPQCDPRFIDGLYGTNCVQAYPSFAITVVEINLDIRRDCPAHTISVMTIYRHST